MLESWDKLHKLQRQHYDHTVVHVDLSTVSTAFQLFLFTPVSIVEVSTSESKLPSWASPNSVSMASSVPSNSSPNVLSLSSWMKYWDWSSNHWLVVSNHPRTKQQQIVPRTKETGPNIQQIYGVTKHQKSTGSQCMQQWLLPVGWRSKMNAARASDVS